MYRLLVLLLLQLSPSIHGELGHGPGSMARSKRQLPEPQDYGLGYMSSPRMLDVQRRIMGQMENELQLKLMARFNAQIDKTLNKDENKLIVKEKADQPLEKSQPPQATIGQPNPPSHVQPESSLIGVPDKPSMPVPSTENQPTSPFLPFQSTQFGTSINDQMSVPPVIQPFPMASGIPNSPFGQMMPINPYSSFKTSNEVPGRPHDAHIPFHGPSAPSRPSLVPRMDAAGSSGNTRSPRVRGSVKTGKEASKVPKEWQSVLAAFQPREGRSLGSPDTGSFGRESRMQDAPLSKPNIQDEWEVYRALKNMEQLTTPPTTTTTTTKVPVLLSPQYIPGMHARMLENNPAPQKTSRTKFRFV
ncbi:hypothetical protein RvY_17286 [Ramazzottius varieornatus]|uniref:Uncharacterized protein n=1 Tax=Ramazzottius varieornatus TaxID=947166 RepID=A0A1D1W2F6_RAMVA|nr:hypothetical protein RvY_17286 [Ramazzottius varieornatus]